MGKLIDIKDNTSYVNAYRAIKKATEYFFMLVSNLPKSMDYVVKNINGSLDNALRNINFASNDRDLQINKAEALNLALRELFALQADFDILVSGHGCTFGQANEVLRAVKDAYSQVDNWHDSVL